MKPKVQLFPKMKILLGALIAFYSLSSVACKRLEADLILINGFVHTVNPDGDIEQAIAIKDGKIVAVGTSDDLKADFKTQETIDLKGLSVYPGFIDAHCHFYGYSMGQNQVDLTGTTSFEEVVALVDSFGKNSQHAWIIGRGWDQNDWDIRDFPTNEKLNKLFPSTPVLLRRIDGHAALANNEALKRANISPSTTIRGGSIEVKKGKLTGLLIDNAVDLVSKIIPKPTDSLVEKALASGEKKLFSMGLTTVDDAGLDKNIIDLIDSLQNRDKLKIRVYAMANPTDENKAFYFENGPYKTDRLNVRSFKLYADGALGSRGACLLAPYSDDLSGKRGFILHKTSHYTEMIAACFEKGFQVNSHCIGDSANRMILNLYGKVLKEKNDLRWRIEHAQVVHQRDFSLFGKYSILPSVQPIHATSDMYWAESRLGKTRMKGAYAYQTLFEQSKTIAIGSDFPVESPNPILGFYAAVVRKDLKGYPFDGFRIEQKLSRETALFGMTQGAAFANFEEKEKGSIEAGKFADLVILDRDIMFCEEGEIPDTKVMMTIVGGEIVYSAGIK